MHGKYVRLATTIAYSLSLKKEVENYVRVIYYPVVYKENVGKFCKGIFKVNRILWLLQKILAQLFPIKLRMHWKKII